MPDQASWIKRVPEILERLESAQAPPFLDRPTVEILFGLRRRQAIALCHRFGGYQIGKTFLVPREAVVRFLRHPQRWSAAAVERARFDIVGRALGEARRELNQRRIVIPVPTETFHAEFSGLPAGIQFQPGTLTVAFGNPPELLEKLFALAQALANDYDTFVSWHAANCTEKTP
jgi:hypothetical protein